MLNTFWQLYGEHMQRVCGYNIIGFDLPFLLRRSFALGITIPAMPPMAKYRVEPTIDLMGILYNWQNYKSLKFVCKRYGIKNLLPELNGSMVNDMDNDTLLKYAKNDVDMTYVLYLKMQGIYF
jgi:DNA polymerase III epsilon subunit-like protein